MARRKANTNTKPKAGVQNASKSTLRKSNRNKVAELKDNIHPCSSKDFEESSEEYELEEEYSESETELKTTKKTVTNRNYTKKQKLQLKRLSASQLNTTSLILIIQTMVFTIRSIELL